MVLHVFSSPIRILESSGNHPPTTLTPPCLLYTLKKPHNVKTVPLFCPYFAIWACGLLHSARVRYGRSFGRKKPLGDMNLFFSISQRQRKKRKKTSTTVSHSFMDMCGATRLFFFQFFMWMNFFKKRIQKSYNFSSQIAKKPPIPSKLPPPLHKTNKTVYAGRFRNFFRSHYTKRKKTKQRNPQKAAII